MLGLVRKGIVGEQTLFCSVCVWGGGILEGCGAIVRALAFTLSGMEATHSVA